MSLLWVGGALLFKIQPHVAYINDVNHELINVYETIKNDIDGLITELEKHKNTSEHFYQVRDWDRDSGLYAALSDTQRAARVIYLNKTCYNGLFRVNNAGEFNTPFGNYKKPSIVNEPTLRAVHSYFNSASVNFFSTDYSTVLEQLDSNCFVYLDPPYDPVSSTANFTGYAKGGFGRDEQLRLHGYCNKLHSRGVKFMLSNSATDFIQDLYSQYNITIVQAKRSINSIAAKRGDVNEVIVRNYE